MKERVLDVLMYLFDHCTSDASNPEASEQDALVKELETAGFASKEINDAFEWLEGIHGLEITHDENKEKLLPFRAFNQEEKVKISPKSLGFLLSLEQIGVVDYLTREVILDRTMALDMPFVREDHFKWIILMVLLNRGSDKSIEWLEDVVFNDNSSLPH